MTLLGYIYKFLNYCLLYGMYIYFQIFKLKEWINVDLYVVYICIHKVYNILNYRLSLWFFSIWYMKTCRFIWYKSSSKNHFRLYYPQYLLIYMNMNMNECSGMPSWNTYMRLSLEIHILKLKEWITADLYVIYLYAWSIVS